jgi:hypothetical protein
MSIRSSVPDGSGISGGTKEFVLEAPHEVLTKYNLDLVKPPRFALASYPQYQGEIDGLANADNFAGVLGCLDRNWIYAVTTDIPAGKRTAFAAYVAARAAKDPDTNYGALYR